MRTSTRMTGKLLAVAALLGVAACGNEADQPVAGAVPLEVIVQPAEQRDVPLFLELVGATLGTQDVPIRARVEGFLETMGFQEGTFVNKGDLLYTIDAQPFQAKVVEAESQLAAARTDLVKTQADLSRIRPLAEMHAVSEQDLDSAVAEEAAARATVKAAQAALDLTNIELSYTRITAPIDGLIGLTQAKPGEFVGREPNPVVLNVLSDINPIRVRFSISEREYLILAREYRNTHPNPGEKLDGPRLTLILADGTEHPETGEVVASSQSVDQDTGTYGIEAAFPNPNLYLLPGQFARVRAPYQTLTDAVVIPRKAVSELQGLFRVYTVNSEQQVSVKVVELGPQAGNDVVIESGLQAGETVIVEGIQKVRPGMPVRAVSVEEAASRAAAATH